MKYNPEIHHRKTIRQKDYDYSQAGSYFVTICTHNREHLFGTIENGMMELNYTGLIVEHILNDLSLRFKNFEIDNYIIMPNHLHVIFIINNDNNDTGNTIGVELALPNNDTGNTAGVELALPNNDTGNTVGVELALPNNDTGNTVGVELALPKEEDNNKPKIQDRASSVPTIPTIPAIPKIVQVFKSLSTIGINKKRNISGVMVWQRNYYEHIIRNDKELFETRKYIEYNPFNWKVDEYNN